LAPRILESAAAEAERLDHHYVGTEHPLQGISRQRETPAGRVLIEKGLDIDAVRGEIARLITEDYLE
jgi:ATP-dependent Clp protease ATP-binding subunit ClpC